MAVVNQGKSQDNCKANGRGSIYEGHKEKLCALVSSWQTLCVKNIAHFSKGVGEIPCVTFAFFVPLR